MGIEIRDSLEIRQNAVFCWPLSRKNGFVYWLGWYGYRDYQIDSFLRFTGPMRMLANLPECPKEDNPFFTVVCAGIDLVRKNVLDLEILPEPYIPRVKSHDFVTKYVNY